MTEERMALIELVEKQADGDLVRVMLALPKGLVGKLQTAACDDRGTTSPGLKPGGRLIREWNGVTHVVDVIEGGFLWKGQRYASLSSIARAITGARWSGPRFFGLKRST